MPGEVCPFVMIIVIIVGIFALFALLLIPNVPYYVVTYYIFHEFWLNHVQNEQFGLAVARAIIFWAMVISIVAFIAYRGVNNPS